MSTATEQFVKDNDYTLSVITTRNIPVGSFSSISRVTRTFNFLAQQVTTATYDAVLGNSGGYKTGGTSGISTTLGQQHFTEFRTMAEVILMHKKLRDLKGHPPPLEDITGDLGKSKKPARLNAPESHG